MYTLPWPNRSPSSFTSHRHHRRLRPALRTRNRRSPHQRCQRHNVDLAKATCNTRAVLALGGRADIPVWPGCLAPLLRAPEDASVIHGATGLGYAVLPEPPGGPSPTHAIDAILAAAREHAGELVLVATGPLTNIAAALLRDPELPRRLKRFVLMGGAFREPGNVTPVAEFNIWHDPEAARIVFRAFGARARRGSSPSASTSRARRSSSKPISPRSRAAAPGCRAPQCCCASSRIPRAIISS